ncbi:Cellular tumor antigen p53, partial [Stegodyphus mimosarum]
MASYQVDESSGRHSVVVPFDNPSAGQEFSTYLYKFTCFGSCAGGPNRRPLMVVFTLEKQRQVIGRRRLDVKICACPGRDKKLEEMSCMTSENNKESTKESSSAFETDEYLAQTERPANYPPAKKAKMSSNEESVYTIAVDDYDCYVFLKLMKHLYHLNILSPERLRTLGSCSQEME